MAQAWSVNHASSHLGFTGSYQGSGFSGQFGSWDAAIHFDPANLAASMAEVTIDMASVDTSDGGRDGSLVGPDFFAVAMFPEAVFRTRSITPGEGEGQYLAEGTLTIRDVSQPVTLPFTLKFSGERALMTGTLELDRSDYGVGQGAWADDKSVAYGVKVDIRLVAEKAG